MPTAENFGDLITADHKVLSEESESRNNHRYAVVVQDLETPWIHSYPCKTKSSQETLKNFMKFLEPTRKPTVIYTDNSFEFRKSCEELSWNHLYVNTTLIRNKLDCRKSSPQSERRDICQSGLGTEWLADSMECYTLLRSIQDLVSDGKTPCL